MKIQINTDKDERPIAVNLSDDEMGEVPSWMERSRAIIEAKIELLLIEMWLIIRQK